MDSNSDQREKRTTHDRRDAIIALVQANSGISTAEVYNKLIEQFSLHKRKNSNAAFRRTIERDLEWLIN